jgi:excisionase family DNA binding protein
MRPHLKHPAALKTREAPSPAKPPQTLALLLARAPDRPGAVAAPDPNPPASDDDVLDVGGVVRMLHVGRNKVYELVGRNEIPHRRLGKQIRFSRAAIVRWLDPCSLQGAKERQ